MHVNFTTTRFIYLSGSEQALCFDKKPNIKGKGNLIEYYCANTNVANILKGFGKLSQTEKSSPWVDLKMTPPRNPFQLELL